MDKDNLQVYMRIFNVLEFTKIMFGMNALPFEVQYMERHNPEKDPSKYSSTKETILESKYLKDDKKNLK